VGVLLISFHSSGEMDLGGWQTENVGVVALSVQVAEAEAA